MVSFEVAYKIDKSWSKDKKQKELMKKILYDIRCVDPKKTNKVDNWEGYHYTQDTDSCLDFTKDTYKKWVKWLKKKVKWPEADKEDDNNQDLLESEVLDHLKSVAENLDDNGGWKDPGDEKKKLRRLNQELKGRRLYGSIPYE